jgi:hypothetical protein
MADRTFSMSTGLDASTVTPGSTPPELSLTVPERVASCAKDIAGIMRSTAITSRRLTTRTSIEARLSEKKTSENTSDPFASAIRKTAREIPLD